MTKRAPTYGDRNESRSRVQSPPRGVGLTEPPPLGVPHEVPFEPTAVLKGDALDAAREDRDWDDRVRHLEKRQDRASDSHASLADAFNEFRVEVVDRFGGVNTAIAGIGTKIDSYASERAVTVQRELVTFTAETHNKVEAKKTYRDKALTVVVAALIAGGGYLFHWLVVGGR